MAILMKENDDSSVLRVVNDGNSVHMIKADESIMIN